MSVTATPSATAITAGNWITESINGMQYDVLLPANYNSAIKYPTMLYLHQLDMGDYPSALLAEVNPWFNTTTFRTDYPAIIVMPLLDQTADPSGDTINFGGVSTADSAGEDNAIAALKQVMSQYSVDTSRVYVTGNSMGGIGTEDMIIKYNAYTGTEGKVFAAGLSLAGADYGQGYPIPNASVVTALKNVPFWAIHGGQDDQVPLAWDQNLYAAEQAIGGDMKYTQDNSLGHDVWDTYYPEDGAGSPLGWLFSQSTGPIVTPKPSPNDTVVTGTTASITDTNGDKWTITTGGQVAVNGIADTSTGSVIELAYVNSTVWQENSSDLWWSKSSASAAWVSGADPLPVKVTPSPNDTVVTGTTASIIDASGNKWTITTGGQVAVNGIADTSTVNVIELAYVNGTVWRENSSHLWWGKSSSTAAWVSGADPLPVKVTPSPNDTVVTGTTASIVDASGDKWTITASGQVAVNGIADTLTGNVVELAYVNGTVWQENSSDLWWGKSSASAPWVSGANPLPVKVTPSPNDTVVTGTTASIIDASGNKWTITASGQVAVNGLADILTGNVIELAYVNGAVWQENSSDLWWGKSSATAAWVSGADPLPVKITSSPNDTVLLGPIGTITDASGVKWTLTAGAQVAINGVADTTSANVAEMAYVNDAVWQENSSNLWWSKSGPTAAWVSGADPLPAPISLAAGTDTISANQVFLVATTGTRMLFLSGSGNVVNLTGGANTISDLGRGNTYILPAAGGGSDTFTSDILAVGDVLDLKTALEATAWNGAASTLSSYLKVSDSTAGLVLSVSGRAIATVDHSATTTLAGLLVHTVT